MDSVPGVRADVETAPRPLTSPAFLDASVPRAGPWILLPASTPPAEAQGAILLFWGASPLGDTDTDTDTEACVKGLYLYLGGPFAFLDCGF